MNAPEVASLIQWAQTEAQARGMRVFGAADKVHDMPWSAVVRLQTDRGSLLAKAVMPSLAHEIPVTVALARWSPDFVARIVASDPQRRYLLMEDAGERLRAVLERDHDIRFWNGILPLYAQIQLHAVPHAAELVALGCPDRRSAALVAAFEDLVATDELLTIAGAQSLTRDQLRALRSLAPQVREWCGELAGTVSETIQHDDLHDGQVFLKDGAARILDWGDANVSHPLFSLVVFERSLMHAFDLAPDAPELLRLRDEYLEPFTQYATRARIAACLPVALRLGKLCRALTWRDVVRALPPGDREADRVPGWLQLFLDPSLR
jgi:hypothetical protein